MTNRTVSARDTTFAGKIAGLQFTAGTATADDATTQGRAVISFAKRHGWAVSGGIATAVVETPADGKPVATWTIAECKAYLDDKKVQYPSGTNVAGLRAAVLDAFETKAQGGSAANESAGHTSGTIPPEGAPPVNNPDKPDNAAVADKWVTPQTGNVTNDVAPAITGQPANVSKVAPATATFTVAATGTPAPTVQWQKQEAAGSTWADIAGATNLSYTTPPTVVATDNGDKYRAVLNNTDGTATSNTAVLTVTAS